MTTTDHDEPTTLLAFDTPSAPAMLPGFDVTPLGARQTGAIDVGATVAHLVRLGRAGAAWRWILGDMVLALADGPDGEDLATAWRTVADLDLDDRPSLMKSVAVAKMVPYERRRSELSWSHHEAVAGIEDAETQAEWLGAAVVNGWTVRQLREELAAAVADDDEEPLFEVAPSTKMPPKVARAIEAAFAEGLARAVVVRPDWTWRVLGDDS